MYGRENKTVIDIIKRGDADAYSRLTDKISYFFLQLAESFDIIELFKL